jgi:hypothetical protein
LRKAVSYQPLCTSNCRHINTVRHVFPRLGSIRVGKPLPKIPVMINKHIHLHATGLSGYEKPLFYGTTDRSANDNAIRFD